MKLLAVNTAFKQANIAFFDGKESFYKTLDSNCKNAEVVLKNIDEILQDNSIRDINTFAVVVGPGSFTGIRIAVALAKGFMVADENLKAISICSLDLMSYIFQKLNPNHDYYVALNALSGNYFVAKYSKSGKCLEDPKMVNGEELELVQKSYVVGLKSEETEFADYSIEITSENLLSLALELEKENKHTAENNLTPLYLRLSQAEQNLKDKEQNDN